MNKDQQVPEYQQAEKSAMEHRRKKYVSIRQISIYKFCLIPHPHCPQMTRRKDHCMTHLIQVQGIFLNQTSDVI